MFVGILETGGGFSVTDEGEGERARVISSKNCGVQHGKHKRRRRVSKERTF